LGFGTSCRDNGGYGFLKLVVIPVDCLGSFISLACVGHGFQFGSPYVGQFGFNLSFLGIGNRKCHPHLFCCQLYRVEWLGR